MLERFFLETRKDSSKNFDQLLNFCNFVLKKINSTTFLEPDQYTEKYLDNYEGTMIYDEELFIYEIIYKFWFIYSHLPKKIPW